MTPQPGRMGLLGYLFHLRLTSKGHFQIVNAGVAMNDLLLNLRLNTKSYLCQEKEVQAWTKTTNAFLRWIFQIFFG